MARKKSKGSMLTPEMVEARNTREREASKKVEAARLRALNDQESEDSQEAETQQAANDQESEDSQEAETQQAANDRKRQRETTNQQGQQREKRQRGAVDQQTADDVSPEGSPPTSSSSEDEPPAGGGRGRGNRGGRGNGGRGRGRGRGNGRGAGNGGGGPEDPPLDGVLEEIIDGLQRSLKPTLPKAPVIRIIRCVASAFTNINRFSAESLQIIHEAVELAIVELFEDSAIMTKHRKRKTTKSSDVIVARQLSGRSFF